MKSTILFVVTISCLKGFTQTTPSAGQKSPAYTFQNIQRFSPGILSVGNRLKRPVILDFWATSCASCITSLPAFDSAYRQFGKSVDFLVVARDYKGQKVVQAMFNTLRVRMGLALPVVYDTASFRLFDVSSVPHYVWINTEGVIAAITDQHALTTNNILSFVKTGSVETAQKINLQEAIVRSKRLDITEPLLLNNNGGNDTNFLYRSVLAKWDKNVPQHAQSYIASLNHHSIQVTGMLLSWLYQMAYGDTIPDDPLRGKTSYGHWWSKPVLSLSDSSDFKFDFSTGKNLYTYSLILAASEKSSPARLQQILQKELDNYFGYKVSVETREMPCWKLEATDDAKEKLRSRTTVKVSPFGSHLGGAFTHISIQELISFIWLYQQKQPPIIDHTGIEYSIDISIDALMTDFTDVQQALLQNGLCLMKATKEMKVIVISDQVKPFKNSYTTR